MNRLGRRLRVLVLVACVDDRPEPGLAVELVLKDGRILGERGALSGD